MWGGRSGQRRCGGILSFDEYKGIIFVAYNTIIVTIAFSKGTLSGDCHGATKTVASRNDILRQKAFYKAPFRGMFRLRYASLNMTLFVCDNIE